jgi:hypothetical protein
MTQDDLDADTRKLAQESIRSTEDATSRLEKLEVKYAKLSMITESLWTLLRDQLKLDQTALKTAMHGVIKNHELLENQKITCPKCKKANAAKKKACVYCGCIFTEDPPASLFL